MNHASNQERLIPVPGEYGATIASTSAVSSAFPRFLAVVHELEERERRAATSWATPRCGRSHERSSDKALHRIDVNFMKSRRRPRRAHIRHVRENGLCSYPMRAVGVESYCVRMDQTRPWRHRLR